MLFIVTKHIKVKYFYFFKVKISKSNPKNTKNMLPNPRPKTIMTQSAFIHLKIIQFL